MEQNRFKSYTLWVAVAALIGMFLGDIGVVEIDVFNTYVEKILYILVLGGILNNPTVKDKL
jgi:uncharacterized membrane protein